MSEATPATPPAGSPIAQDELAGLRTALPAVSDVAYLNAGTLGPLPLRALEAMRIEHTYDAERRQGADLWERLGSLQGGARDALATLTGVGSDQVALMHSTHEGINVCLWGLDLRAGDNVVTTGEEHPGVLVPLRHVRDRSGCEVRIAAWGSDDDAFVDELMRQVDDRTRAVVVSHVSWLSGRTAPLSAVRHALPPGCRLIVDGAQSAGIVPVDPTHGWDAYTVSGQKWPCGPNGSGGLALTDPEAWLPTYGAFMHVRDYADCLGSAIVTDGRRFETSQEAMVPLAGFAASVHWLLEEVGIARAHAHAQACNAHARRAIAALGDDRLTMLGEGHLLCVDIPARRAETVAGALVARGIVIRSLGDSRIRISFGAWNTREELDAAVLAMGEALADPAAR